MRFLPDDDHTCIFWREGVFRLVKSVRLHVIDPDFTTLEVITANPSGRMVFGLGLWPLASWDCGFETRWGHGCLFLDSVVCGQIAVSATVRSLVLKSPTERECVLRVIRCTCNLLHLRSR
jgi:hypothetical protein